MHYTVTQKTKQTKKQNLNLELFFSPNPGLNYTCSIVENNGYWLLHGQGAMDRYHMDRIWKGKMQ
jgi:hypothetical protein